MEPHYPWDDEPNVGATDAYGYRCRLRRNTDLGTWCGYVVIPADHPWYGVSLSDLDDVRVHGGVTYSGDNLYEGEWVIGFDCGHAFDLIPKLMTGELGNEPPLGPQGIYRDYDYAMGEAAAIAQQAQQAVANPDDPLDRSDEELTRALKRLRGEVVAKAPEPGAPPEYVRHPDETDGEFKRRIIEDNARVAAGMAPRRRPKLSAAAEARIDDPERKDPW
jgi:hypothetical protein